MVGYVGRPFGVLGPCTHRLGPLRTPRSDFLVDGRETCVVSQVVADSLARLPLEGCRDTRCVHGGKWRERV